MIALPVYCRDQVADVLSQQGPNGTAHTSAHIIFIRQLSETAGAYLGLRCRGRRHHDQRRRQRPGRGIVMSAHLIVPSPVLPLMLHLRSRLAEAGRVVEDSADLLTADQKAADVVETGKCMLLIFMSLHWANATVRSSPPPLLAQASCKGIVFGPGSSSASLAAEAPSVDRRKLCYRFHAKQGQHARVNLALNPGAEDVVFSIPDMVDVHEHYVFQTETRIYEVRVFAPRPYADVSFVLMVSIK